MAAVKLLVKVKTGGLKSTEDREGNKSEGR